MANEDRRILINGRPDASPSLPALFADVHRGAASADASKFLPAGFLQATASVDLSLAQRGEEGAAEPVAMTPGDVVVLELGDGVTVITSPERLQEVLERYRPEGATTAPDLGLLERRMQGAAERGVLGDLAAGVLRRITTLTVGSDPILEAAAKKLKELTGDKLKGSIASKIEFGATWLGTRVLMQAIESQLDQKPGLYRWSGIGDKADALEGLTDDGLAAEAGKGAFLVFVHGTGSSTNGGFGDLKRASSAEWRTLAARYDDRILALEHRTFSESPIENALALAKALPAGATIDLVTHSRGGLVGDFLSLGEVDATLIDAHFGEEKADKRGDAKDMYAAHRAALRELVEVLARKKLRVERYVRVAAPARGTRLASENLDAFLSGLLTLIGLVPALRLSPLYAAVQRIVLEIARNRMKANVVPGIEAMLPESPVGAFLARVAPAPAMRLAVIAGDIEGGGLLKKLGVFFTDSVFFDGVNNDLVVDTDSMYAGVARPGNARFRFEQGPDVNHFRYFENSPSRRALCDWLTARDDKATQALIAFAPLPAAPAERSLQDDVVHARSVAATRAAPAPNQPIVIVLPGIMGSHLRLRRTDDHVWLDPVDIMAGGLEKLKWTSLDDDVEPEKLFDRFYGDLCDHLAATHRVERFPYDWRKTVEAAAQRLAQRVESLLEETKANKPPIRFLAHSMGGLVVRAMIALHPDLWERVNERGNCRFVMLGTPNQGSHSMVSTLLGKDDTVRKLARLVDLKHDLQELLDIIKGFRGALQLLPRPGFTDVAGAEFQKGNYYDAAIWPGYRAQNKDFWFGNGILGAPDKAALDEARALWEKLDDFAKARLPDKHRDRIVYVCGQSMSTPCGVKLEGGRWKVLVTAEGDGTVSWKSGLIEGLQQDRNVFFMHAEHGSLPSTDSAFPALVDLLQNGDTQHRDQLSRSPSVARDALPAVRAVDVGPVPFPTADEVLDSLAGRRRTPLPQSRKQAVLRVSCTAMDLRFATRPILVGHYDRDAISGAEAIIDRDVVRGQLSMRHHLGLYAGRLGTATVVLTSQTEQERQRDSLLGAVVVGLGELGDLNLESLTEAVRAGVLRYLMQLVDNEAVCGKAVPEDVKLASLLLGYNSTTNVSIEASVGAIVRGTLEANRQFAAQTQRPLRVTDLEFVELYLDAAISATKALQRAADRLNEDAARNGMRIVAAPTLNQLNGWRHRLDAQGASTYWPRILVSRDERRDGEDSAAAEIGGVRPRLQVADRLKYVFLGQRARAESVFQQRQPGLVERLMERAISVSTPQPEFSRTLFQVLVPHDFKETTRQLDRLVLVVDGYTANLPWELMVADDEPLAIRMAMVRQFSTGTFRVRIRPTLERCAYVIGNPPTDGFDSVFPASGLKYLPFLGGAVAEAKGVIEVLQQNNFQPDDIVSTVGEESWLSETGDDGTVVQPSPAPRALEIINKLYRRNYRIVHIAAHGIHDLQGADGLARTGVVLSDGVLITAAEIESMEVVPDLVFLNCCHLGKIDSGPIPFNRLAYSLARKLIEIGVRAVIVAGWAVDDAAAKRFAEDFYRYWLGERRAFGDAVFKARTNVYAVHGARCNTWGAFQAYGDPGLLFDPVTDAGPGYRKTRNWRPAAPEELVDRLAALRSDIARIGTLASAAEARDARKEGMNLLAQAPAEWGERPDVLFAWARLLGDLGAAQFDSAREAYLAALRATDMDRHVPTRALEELANLEARAGQKQGSTDRIEGALARLDHFARAVMPDGTHPNAEHAALVGSAAKRLAAMFGQDVLDSLDGGKDLDAALSKCRRYLNEGATAYRRSSGEPGTASFKPYLALNALGLEAARDFLDFALGGEATWEGDAARNSAGIELARACIERANAEFSRKPDVWNAVMPADAAVAMALLDRSLAEPGEAGNAVFERLQAAYHGALEGVRATPKERDSVATQLQLLGLLLRVAARAMKQRTATRPADAAARIVIALERLEALEARIAVDEGAAKKRTVGTSKKGDATDAEAGAVAAAAPASAAKGVRKRAPAKKPAAKKPSAARTVKTPRKK